MQDQNKLKALLSMQALRGESEPTPTSILGESLKQKQESRTLLEMLSNGTEDSKETECDPTTIEDVYNMFFGEKEDPKDFIQDEIVANFNITVTASGKVKVTTV